MGRQGRRQPKDVKQEELDAARVILWGSSFSGGHVIEATAADPAIATAIVQVLFTNGPASCLAMDPLNLLKVSAHSQATQKKRVISKEPINCAPSRRPPKASRPLPLWMS